jgi:hypothetical protein
MFYNIIKNFVELFSYFVSCILCSTFFFFFFIKICMPPMDEYPGSATDNRTWDPQVLLHSLVNMKFLLKIKNKYKNIIQFNILNFLIFCNAIIVRFFLMIDNKVIKIPPLFKKKLKIKNCKDLEVGKNLTDLQFLL